MMTTYMRISMLSLVLLLAFTPNDAKRANEAYKQGDYATAAELYQKALESDPDNAQLHFNLGNALANMGRTEEATQAYENFKSLTEDPQDLALADYNIGKLYSDKDELNKAAEYFRNSLRNNPDDPDARHNYELALRQQQQNQQQDQNQDQEGNDDQNQDQEQNQDQNDQGDQQEEEQDQNQGNQQQDPGDQEESDSQQQQQPQMSLEEAESILEALEQRERELIRNRKKEAEEEPSNNEKDW